MSSSRPEPSPNRRRALRTVFTPGSPCHAVAAPDYRCRPGIIRDVSRTGVGLVLAEPLPVDTLLAIRPEGAVRLERVTALRVRHATPLGTGGWLVGCSHAADLDPADMSALRKALDAVPG